jgi:hypothetical protein
MKKISFLFFMMVIALSSLMAQTTPPPPKQGNKGQMYNKEKMDAMKIGFMTKELELTEQQAQTFWPIYNKHEEEKKALRKSFFGDSKKGDIIISELSEEEADKMINNYLGFKTNDLDLTKKYVAEYKKVLSTKQVAKLLASEEKFKKMLVNQAGGPPNKPNVPGKKPMMPPPPPPAPK